MNWPLLRAIVILPGNVAVVIPGLILWLSHGTALSWALAGPAAVVFWLALACLASGLGLMIPTVTMFLTVGKGTPAPWDPPKKLVVRGVYRYLRNPMISGVILFLLGEALLFRSWQIAGWAVLFALGNMIYMPLVEEPGLERRFGADYRIYKKNVPRWFPRWKPWNGLSPG